MKEIQPPYLPLGVCVLPSSRRNTPNNVSYAHYIHEILRHFGVYYHTVGVETLASDLPRLRMLLTVGDTPLPDSARHVLERWVQQGGMWLAVGSPAGAPELFGVQEEPPAYSGWGATSSALGEGYLVVQQPQHPILAHVTFPLHFFNGVPVCATEGRVLAQALDAHQRQTDRALLVERQVGQGVVLLLAVDATGSVVRIQQGVAVTRDRVSAPDGTASVSDGVLKSSDGSVLDWWFDRQPLPGLPQLSACLYPVADMWKEIVMRAILYLAQRSRVPLPILWLYPRNLPALAHLSHDTDANDPLLAQEMLRILREARVCSTWCVILPGYPLEIIRNIRAEGHELAMHYDAMEEGTEWSEQEFYQQYERLTTLFERYPPTTNKNHYLRWEGDTEFFGWCQRRGIQLDQSKGPSKTGEAGFPFGTCHPYFPLSPAGELYDVIELPTLTQDLHLFAPDALLEPLLQAVLQVHGVLHLLFHPAHINKPGVADALVRAVREARRNQMEWWTAQQINAWERARRSVRCRAHLEEPTSLVVQLDSETPLLEATLLLVGAEGEAEVVGGNCTEVEQAVRWGTPVTAVTFDLYDTTTIRWRLNNR